MKIAILDRATLGNDVDVSIFEQFGELIVYDMTSEEQTQDRVKEIRKDKAISKLKPTTSGTHLNMEDQSCKTMIMMPVTTKILSILNHGILDKVREIRRDKDTFKSMLIKNGINPNTVDQN